MVFDKENLRRFSEVDNGVATSTTGFRVDQQHAVCRLKADSIDRPQRSASDALFTDDHPDRGFHGRFRFRFRFRGDNRGFRRDDRVSLRGVAEDRVDGGQTTLRAT